MKFPSVTQILSPFSDFSKIRPDVLEAAAAKGTRVHAACALICKGGWPVVAPEEQGYVDSFLRWFSRVEQVHHIEEEFRDEAMGFMGHPDLVVTWEGRSMVVDLKTPVGLQKLWELQLAGYGHLVRKGTAVEAVATLQLDPQGGIPKAHYVKNEAQAFAAFFAALQVWRYLND